jgi:hypothetical protein
MDTKARTIKTLMKQNEGYCIAVEAVSRLRKENAFLLEACKLWIEALPDLKCNKAYESIMADIIAKTNQAINQTKHN